MFLLEIIEIIESISVLKPYVKLQLHKLDNLEDINEFKSLCCIIDYFLALMMCCLMLGCCDCRVS